MMTFFNPDNLTFINDQKPSRKHSSQQCILLYILDLHIPYMLLKLQLTVQYKIKNIYAAVVLRHRIEEEIGASFFPSIP